MAKWGDEIDRAAAAMAEQATGARGHEGAGGAGSSGEEPLALRDADSDAR
jgi:hypothetical protein